MVRWFQAPLVGRPTPDSFRPLPAQLPGLVDLAICFARQDGDHLKAGGRHSVRRGHFVQVYKLDLRSLYHYLVKTYAAILSNGSYVYLSALSLAA